MSKRDSYSRAALKGFGDVYNNAALKGFGDVYNDAALRGGKLPSGLPVSTYFKEAAKILRKKIRRSKGAIKSTPPLPLPSPDELHVHVKRGGKKIKGKGIISGLAGLYSAYQGAKLLYNGAKWVGKKLKKHFAGNGAIKKRGVMPTDLFLENLMKTKSIQK